MNEDIGGFHVTMEDLGGKKEEEEKDEEGTQTMVERQGDGHRYAPVG